MFYQRRFSIKSFTLNSSGCHSPLNTHNTFIFSWYSKSGNSLGVIKNVLILHFSYWEVCSEQELCTNCPCTNRSFLGSIPWLISSTTMVTSQLPRNGLLESDCNAIKYVIVDTDRSYYKKRVTPPDWRWPVRGCNFSESLNLTRISIPHWSMRSWRERMTSPAHPISKNQFQQNLQKSKKIGCLSLEFAG